MEMEPGRSAAGKQHAVDIPVFQQRLAGLFPPLNQVDNAVRDPGLQPQLHRQFGGGGGQLARLKHHGIPGNQRRNNVSVRQVTGEIVGAENGHHAVRLVAQQRFTVRHRRFALAGTLAVGFNRDARFANHRLHFGPGFPQRLAGFPGDKRRQRLFLRFQQGRKSLNAGDALRQRSVGPGIECAARRRAGRLHLRRTGAGRLPQDGLIFRSQFGQRCAAPLLPLPCD